MFSSVSVRIWLENGKLCKNDDHTCLFLCIITRKMFEQSAYRPCVQTASSVLANLNV